MVPGLRSSNLDVEAPGVAQRRLLLRLGLCVVAIFAATLVQDATEDPALKAVTPLFAILLLAQLFPMFLSKPDAFSPPVFNGIYAGLATVAMAIGMYVGGSLDVHMIKGLDPGEMMVLGQKVLWASIIAQVAYLIGYYKNPPSRWSRLFPNVAGLEWDVSLAWRIMAGIMIVFVFAYAYFQLSLGLPLFQFRDHGAGRSVWRGRAELSWMLRGVELGFVPVLFHMTLQISQKRLLRLLPALAGLAVVGLLVLRLGTRGRVMYAVLIGVMLFHYLWRRLPAAAFAAALFLFVPVSNLMYQWRQTTTRQADIDERMTNPFTELAEHEGERQRFGAMALIMKEFPENRPYLLGESWMALLVVPVPRWLWPEKDQHFIWRESRIVPNLGGGQMPAPLSSTLYANFSWVGIFVGMYLWGKYQRALYEWLRDNPSDKNVVLLYSVNLAFFTPTLLGVSAAMQYVLPLWLVIRVIGKKPALVAKLTPVAKAPPPVAASTTARS